MLTSPTMPASFCDAGQTKKDICARLIDAHSGVAYPVANLAELLALVRRLVTKTLKN